MKKIIYGVFILLLSVGVVYAQEYTYEICEDCTYTSLSSLYNLLYNIPSDSVVHITIGEGEYNFSSTSFQTNNSGVTMDIQGSGVDKTIINMPAIFFHVDNVMLSDMTFHFTDPNWGLRFYSSNVELERLNINANDNALVIHSDICYNKSIPNEVHINDVEVQTTNSDSVALLYSFQYGTGHKIFINHSTLDSPYSIFYEYLNDSSYYVCGCYSYDADRFNVGELDYQIYVENSTLNKIYAYRAKDDRQVAVFLSDTNTMNLGGDRNEVLLEEEFGKIIFEVKKQIQIDIHEDLHGLVLGVFTENGDTLDFSNIDYTIEDESVIKYQDGKFIPLRVGKTNIVVKNGNTQYVLGVTITEEDLPKEENPNTKDLTYVLFGLFLLSSLLFFIVKRRMV